MQKIGKYYTLKFKKEVLNADQTPPGTNLVIPDCKLYSLYDNETLLGQIYFDFSFSFADFGELQVIIRPDKDSSNKLGVYVFNYKTQEKIAQVKYSFPFDSHSGDLEIFGSPKYYFHSIQYESFKLFKPKTWGNQKWRLSNGINEIIISGTLVPAKWSQGIARLSLSGTVQFKDGSNLLPAICGFYFAECGLDSQDRAM